MKRYIFIILFLGIIYSTFAQDPYVKDINLKIKNNKVLIDYKVKNSDIGKHNVELFFIDEDFRITVPKSLSGDIGKNIDIQGIKNIEWEIFKDDILLAKDLKPRIIIDGIKYGGPRNAYLSMLIPGLGDYFVKDTKRMIIKPYMRTVATLGLIGLGVTAAITREKVPIYSLIYNSSYRFHDDTNGDGVFNDSDRWVEQCQGYKYKNWLFPNDKDIFFISGITLWAADVIWVMVKGSENRKIQRFSNYSMTPIEGGASMKYSLNF